MTAPPPDFLTVHELADLLRIKERKVYDLAASGQIPCSRATGKLLFPEAEIRAWIDTNRSGPATGGARDAIFVGSHDPLLEWALRQSCCGLPTYFDGSLDGLHRFRDCKGIGAGLHLLDAESGQWNVPQVAAEGGGTDAVLIGWALRRRGLVVRAADRLTSLEDLRGRRLITRQPGSGAELLLAHLLKQSGIGDSDITLIGPARSETDAAQAVAQGAADAALGLEAGAAQLGLSFVPIIEERFDLLLDRTAYFEPPLQAFLDFCQTQALRDQAQALGGYDMRDLGRVRWNG